MSIQAVVSRFRTGSNGLFSRTAALIGIVVAIAGPFLLLTIGGSTANRLPWYVWIMIPAFLLIVIEIGIVMFRHGGHDSDDISISPRNR